MKRQGVRSNHSSRVANAVVVATAEEAADQEAGNPALQEQSPVPPKPSWQDTSSSTEASTSGMQDIRSRLTERGFSSDATSVLLNC